VVVAVTFAAIVTASALPRTVYGLAHVSLTAPSPPPSRTRTFGLPMSLNPTPV